MTVKSIPEGSIEIQAGLWAAIRIFRMSGVTYFFYDLYSSEGYCFWEVNQPENYDKEGNLLPMEQRIYAQYAITCYTTIDELNKNYISVPMADNYQYC